MTRTPLYWNLGAALALCFMGCEDTSQAPGAAKPTEAAAKPTEDAAKPTEEAAKPTEEAAKPTEDAAKPTEEAAKPTEDAAKPTEAAAKPTEDAAKPTEAAAKPTEDAAKPTEDAAKPAEDAAKPTEDAAKPTEDAAKPAEDAAKPTEDAAKPAEDAAKPAEAAAKPTEDAAKPAEDAAKPAEDAAAEPVTMLLPGVRAGAAVWAQRSPSAGPWARGVVGALCDDGALQVTFGDSAVCRDATLVAADTAPSKPLGPGSRVIMAGADKPPVVGTVHKVTKDYLIRLDADGTQVGASFVDVRALGLGDALAPAPTELDADVYAQLNGGPFRAGIRGAACPGGFDVMFAADATHCLAPTQIAPDRFLSAVTEGARVLQAPRLGDKDALAGTVLSVQGATVSVRWDGRETTTVKLDTLRLLRGAGTLGAIVPKDPKRCAKQNLRNRAFSYRGNVGFKYTNRCLRAVKCRMKIEYYCADNEGDGKTDWFHCDKATGPGESISCSHKRCRRPRRGDEAHYKSLICEFVKPR